MERIVLMNGDYFEYWRANAAPVGAGAAKSDSSNRENQLLYGRLTNTQYT